MKYIKGRGLAVAAILILLVALAIAGCAKPTPTPTGPIKIGAIFDYTGDFAGIGQLVEEGVRLRLDQSGWEVAGRKIELITEDSQSSADSSVEKARKLIGVDKVDEILPSLKAEACEAAAGYCAEQGLPCVSIQSYRGDMVKQFKTFIMLYGPVEGQHVGLGRYAVEKLGYKTATVLCPDFVFGHQVATSFEYGFKEKGGTIVKETFIPFGTMDFSPFLTGMGKPDCLVIFLASPTDGIRFFKQFQEFGLTVPVLWPECDSIEPALPEIGQTVLGVIGCTPYTWTINSDINKQFVDAYSKEHNGIPPNTFTENGYAGISVYLEAVKATGGDTTPSKVIDATKGMRVDLPGGVVKFTHERMGQRDIYIVEGVKMGSTYAWEVRDKYPLVPPGE